MVLILEWFHNYDLMAQVLPERIRLRWHGILEDTNKKFMELIGRRIANLLVVMDTPDELVVPCSTGTGVTFDIVVT